MSPPVISWFFSPALALWPAPHDDVKTTLSDKRNDRSDLDRASPADSLRSSASPSLREGEDVLLACEAESALLLRIRTLLHGLPRNRILRSALHLTSIDKASDGHRRGPPRAVAFTFRLGLSLLARQVNSRPQTSVFVSWLLQHRKKFWPQPGSTRRCLWAPWLSTERVLAFGAWLLLYYNMCAGAKN